MKFLVTGAAGFIGSSLSARLKKSGFEVMGIDNFTPYYSTQLKEARSERFLSDNQIKIERIDLCNLEATYSVVRSFNPDSIIHLAAQPGIRTPFVDSNLYIQNNLVAYSNILQVAVHTNTPNFLYASSSSVYGNSIDYPYREDNKSITPISIYGATKLSNEILASAYISGSNTRARGMRFFTVYGPWGRPDMAYFRIINSAINGSKFEKFGNGEVKRDFTYIDDITLMIESLALQLGSYVPEYSDIVNIGGGHPYSLNELIEMISIKTNSKISIEEFRANPSDTKHTAADLTSLISLTNKQPEVDLEKGVELTLDWAKLPTVRMQLPEWIDSTI